MNMKSILSPTASLFSKIAHNAVFLLLPSSLEQNGAPFYPVFPQIGLDHNIS